MYSSEDCSKYTGRTAKKLCENRNKSNISETENSGTNIMDSLLEKLTSMITLSKTKDYSFLSNFCSGFSKEDMPFYCLYLKSLEQPEITGYKERSCFDCLTNSPPSVSATECLFSTPCLIPIGIITAIGLGIMFIIRRK